MKRRLITVVLFAVFAAAVSSALLYNIISANTGQTPKGATVPVFVAARDLNPGAVVAATDIREVQWWVNGASPWIGRRQDVVGRVLSTPVGKNEPFADKRLVAKGGGAGLASKIPPGMRAVAVHVDELTGLSRFIFPGMHVDIISTGAPGSQSGPGAGTRTILQNVEVLSTGQNIEPDARARPAGVPVFNLLVTPQQAEVLSQAAAQNRIQLVLRNPLDTSSFLPAPVPPVRTVSATARPRAPRAIVKAPAVEKAAAPPPPPPPPTVEVIHGTRRAVSVVAKADDADVNQPEPKQ